MWGGISKIRKVFEKDENEIVEEKVMGVEIKKIKNTFEQIMSRVNREKVDEQEKVRVRKKIERKAKRNEKVERKRMGESDSGQMGVFKKWGAVEKESRKRKLVVERNSESDWPIMPGKSNQKYRKVTGLEKDWGGRGGVNVRGGQNPGMSSGPNTDIQIKLEGGGSEVITKVRDLERKDRGPKSKCQKSHLKTEKY